MRHSPAEFIGVDVGEARVGLARGSAMARIAEPVKTVPAGQAVPAIKDLARENRSEAIVVGLPRGLDGNETPQTVAVRNWAKQAAAQINLPFYWQDEALTSRAAEARPAGEAGPDANAAALILQDFLDGAENDRVAV